MANEYYNECVIDKVSLCLECLDHSASASRAVAPEKLLAIRFSFNISQASILYITLPHERMIALNDELPK